MDNQDFLQNNYIKLDPNRHSIDQFETAYQTDEESGTNEFIVKRILHNMPLQPDFYYYAVYAKVAPTEVVESEGRRTYEGFSGHPGYWSLLEYHPDYRPRFSRSGGSKPRKDVNTVALAEQLIKKAFPETITDHTEISGHGVVKVPRVLVDKDYKPYPGY